MNGVFSEIEQSRLMQLANAIFEDRFQQEIELRDKRIAQLEKLNESLAKRLDSLERGNA